MANGFYQPFKNNILTQAAAQVDFDGDTIKVYLIDAGAYTVDLTNHDFADDIAGGAKIATATLVSVSISGNVLDAADTTFSSVSGASIEAIVIWKDTGTQSTSRLVCYIDTATGLPVTPNGGDITVTWDNGSNKIFAL